MGRLISVIFVLLSFVFMFSCGVDFSRKDVEKTNIFGKITKKYLDEWNHEEPTVICRSDENEFKYQMSAWRRKSDLWEYLQVGDSLIKPAGSLTLRVKKENGEYKDYKYQR